MRSYDAIFRRYICPMSPVPTGVAADLTHMQPFAAVLFDVYGTLLISGAGDIGMTPETFATRDDVRSLLKAYRIDFTPQKLAAALHRSIERSHETSRRQGIDYPEVDIVQIWMQVLGPDNIARIRDFALQYELLVNPVYPMPGLEELLTAAGRATLPMGMVSNAQFFTVDVLEHLLGTTLEQRGFDPRLLFFSWREGHAKPSAFMFDRAKTALQGMGIPAAEVLFVGNDMRSDILPAVAAGFKTALFAGDRRSLRLSADDDRCRDLKPDLIVTDLRQLIPATGNID